MRRLPWLPWLLAVCFAASTAWFAYQHYRLQLLYYNYLYRDEIRTRALEDAQTRALNLQQQLDRLKAQPSPMP